MSLTGKLILGFLFALVLQIAQIVVSGLFTGRVQEASTQVANALSASLAVQNGLEAIAQLRGRCNEDRLDPDGLDCRVQAVFVEELGLQLRALSDVLPAVTRPARARLDRELAALDEQLGSLQRSAQNGPPEERADGLAFLEDAAQQLEQELRRIQVSVKTVAQDGVRLQQAVHDLPLQSGLAIAFTGVVVMALFVGWFSRQLVVPIERARAELEQRVADRTRELADTVSALERQIVERERAEAQKDELHRQLVDASRRAGMAELATGVLHNVGNVLNSVNVSAELLGHRLRESQVRGVDRVAGLLRSHADDLPAFAASPQGRLLPDYLSRLAEHLTREHAEMIDEAAGLRARIDHMKDIVVRQQSYARCAGVRAPVQIGQLVDEVVGMHRTVLDELGIEVATSIDGDDLCELDRSRVLQILMNLVGNAKHAIRDAGRRPGRIEVAIRRRDGQVTIRVIDNGVGIAAEDLTNVFRHGFTTKKDGHGFGLHHSANAASEMGGRLRAESPGRGGGATFTLELPVGAAAMEPV